MSVDELSGGVGAERMFWGTPELVEKLLPLLDLKPIKQLAVAHKLTRQILGKAFIWNKLIKRIFPRDHNIDVRLKSEVQKAKLLSVLLSLSEDSDRSQLGMDLIHTICERHPILDPNSSTIDMGCSCGQTHSVSKWGCLLLKEVEARGQESHLCVDQVKAKSLQVPLLTAVSSMVAAQQGMVKKLAVYHFVCKDKETADAIAVLLERTHTVEIFGGDFWRSSIFIEGEIGTEGWSSIRRAVDHLATAVGKDTIILFSSRTLMREGGRDDLKAILENSSHLSVSNDEDDRYLILMVNSWEGWGVGPRGLEAVIYGSVEEWLEELTRYGATWETDEDSEEEDEMGQQEGQAPGHWCVLI